MQDSLVTPAPQVKEIKKDSIDKSKILKILSSIILLFILIIIIFAYRNKKEDDIQNAKADIIAQAVELNNLEQFSIYKDQAGGLYQGGANQPQLAHRVKVQKQLEQIQPLNAEGVNDSSGQIGVVFIGDPFTKGEIDIFNEYIQGEASVNSALTFIDGSEDKFDTKFWEKSLFAWENLVQKTKSENLTSKQVQIIWLNLSFGEYDIELANSVNNYTENLQNIIKNALINFPNSKIVYLSSPRSANNSTLVEYIEPNSYETAFGVREIIRKQEEGKLNYKESIQTLSSEPVLIWGPYVWTKSNDGTKEFSYTTDNFESDGLTLSTAGKQRYALDLYDFWANYEFSRSWFLSK